MNGKRKQSKVTLLLRAAAGVYLVWLAWGLREAVFSGEALFSLAAAVFLVAGVILLLSAVPPLIHGDFLDSGKTEEEPGDGAETASGEPEEAAGDDETE